MANSPFKVIKTHLWSEVKNYTWGNLTIGQNFKTVSSSVQGTQYAKRKSIKILFPSFVIGVSAIGKCVARLFALNTKLISLVFKKSERGLKSQSSATSTMQKGGNKIITTSVASILSSAKRNINRLTSSLTSVVSSLNTVFILGIIAFEKAVVTNVTLVSNVGKSVGKGLIGIINLVATSSKSVAKNILIYISGLQNIVRNISRSFVLNTHAHAVKFNISFRLFTANNIANTNLLRLVGKRINFVVENITLIRKSVMCYLVSYTLDLPVTLKSFSRVFTSNVKIHAERINKPLLNFKSNVITSSSLFFGNFKTTVANVTSHINKNTYVGRHVSTFVNNISFAIRSSVFNRVFSSIVKVVYNVPPTKWGDNLVRTWGSLSSEMWVQFKGLTATSVRKRVFKKPNTPTTNVITNYVKQTKRVFSNALNISGNLFTRLGKAIVQSMEAVSVHSTTIAMTVIKTGVELLSSVVSFVHEIFTIKEDAIKISATHKVKQEVIWRMGANSRGETLHMVLGETKVIELTVVNEDGTPTDLLGATVRFAIDGAVEKDCGIVDNKITVMIEPDDIKNAGTYSYEFRLKDIFEKVDSLIIGKVIVEPKIVSAY